MVGDCALSVPVLLNSLGNFSVSFAFVVQYTPVEYFFKCRSIGISLALGYLGNIFVSIEVINEAVNKIIFAEDGLALNLTFIPLSASLLPMPRAILGLVNNHKTCTNSWTRHGTEDFLVRQKAERVMDKELHQ